jgi:hypothetical protein
MACAEKLTRSRKEEKMHIAYFAIQKSKQKTNCIQRGGILV